MSKKLKNTAATKDEIVAEIEDGMGSEGDHKTALQIFAIFEEKGEIEFDPQAQLYFYSNLPNFMEIWREVDGGEI